MSPYMIDAQPERELSDTIRDAAPYLDEDPVGLPLSIDPFTVTSSTGFMPLHPPLIDVPPVFAPVAALVEDMPVVKLDGLPGLLAKYQLGPAIDRGDLPDLTVEIDNLRTADGEHDMAAITAVFRDYAFLTSAYLLEPCWERWSKGLEGYGLGRQTLPAGLAGPLLKTADILDVPPYMSYAAAYALYNYRFADPAVRYDDYNNLRLIRAFECGLDPTSSEAGFVLTHVDMVRHSSGLVKGSVDLLNAVAHRNETKAQDAFTLLLDTMGVVEQSMETMWTHSKPKDYISYRTFIFGITNQSMFPDGVVYEGHNDNKPMFLRGESGANDSMMPLLDGLLQIPMPTNPLTDILKDFRSYRPKPHREFLAAVRQQAERVGVRDYCCQDVQTAVLYLRLLDHVRSFRWRHWLFAREYIIRRSSHPTATGGSPIIRWLPNQLFAVMDLMQAVWNGIRSADGDTVAQQIVEMMNDVQQQRGKLQREVDRWCQKRSL